MADDARRLIFVSMTNLLLISSLVSLMSMSLEGVCRCYPVAITDVANRDRCYRMPARNISSSEY